MPESFALLVSELPTMGAQIMTSNTEKQRYLRPREAASYIGISTSTLAKMRLRGDGPPYSKAGRAVVYDLDEIDEWLRVNARRSTSEELRGRAVVSSKVSLAKSKFVSSENELSTATCHHHKLRSGE